MPLTSVFVPSTSEDVRGKQSGMRLNGSARFGEIRRQLKVSNGFKSEKVSPFFCLKHQVITIAVNELLEVDQFGIFSDVRATAPPTEL